MAFRNPFAPGEHYHCYNRGVDKRVVFKARQDYERFLSLLYVCNGSKNIQLSDRRDTSLHSILADKSIDRGTPLTNLEVYSLMPNHVHFILQETATGGITIFMQKVFTGYTMYFNRKYRRSGALFAGPFKSRHIFDDLYFKQVVPYVLLNPIELFEPDWKVGKGNPKKGKERLLEYPYSSLPDFFGKKRSQGKLIGDTLHSYYDSTPSLKTMLRAAQEYYREHPEDI